MTGTTGRPTAYERLTVAPWPVPAGRHHQEPPWAGHPALGEVSGRLSTAPPLVSVDEVGRLRDELAAVARGDALVLQAGDCAENLEECGPEQAAARVTVLDALGDHLERSSGRRVVRIGRLAGQFAKPRSQPTERVGGRELPVFRGHMVNSAEPTAEARRPDPWRMLRAYEAAGTVLDAVRKRRGDRDTGPWASHEALVLDYELPLVRGGPEAVGPLLTSTHLPWVGERTRQPGSRHVTLLASVANPVACKIGPTATPDEVLLLSRLLDPGRTPGRLTLIVRMGRAVVAEALPPLVAAVRRAGHPVVWLCDPMHGNTVRAVGGRKTRYLPDLIAEAAAFRAVLEQQGQHAGGVHLETAADDVSECVGGPVGSPDALARRYTTLCDPRLNPEQARRFLNTWA
ncbi:3-deoxy-7-phosphoheptulonate synthase [Streptomyces huiliensis]|uniref:3-deoxy-7-phosphoheptulonate synthase n=1 Tax=Streptomyces huiliensis TaxID=2876027 RepID=UPI001CBAA611|nr:3-deoxy-7-phosphoheptulonate synthase [Streptomyces huiliensis]MBZ4317855.1 3-deoxy-7-phosphoheptulonate synthase [Streptomyces huiliensis]